MRILTLLLNFPLWLIQRDRLITLTRAEFLPLLGGEGRGEGGRFTNFVQPFPLANPAILSIVSKYAANLMRLHSTQSRAIIQYANDYSFYRL
jgi:hypothetical protein